MPALLPVRRRTPLAVLAVALVASAAGLATVTPAVAAAPGCSFSQLDVVAHEDDDLLFQSPDLITSIQNGSCVTTAYLTAGDDGMSTSYWQGREAGMKAAYAQMSGVGNSWSDGSLQLAGQTVATSTLDGNAKVRLVFFRLPDGGFPTPKAGSLPNLEKGTIGSLGAIDGSASYSKASLTAALLELMTDLGADTVHTQDYVGGYRSADHQDHTATALLAEDASDQYPAAHTLVSYMDYESAGQPVNVGGAALNAKIAAFDAYTPYDPQICRPVSACSSSSETAWLQRQYVLDTRTYAGPAPTPTPTPVPTETAAPAPTQTAAPTQPTTPVPPVETAPPVVPAPPVTPTAPALPAEQGTPKVVLQDASLTTKQFQSKGVSATISGLTPRKQYQLSYLVGDSGALIGKPVTASAKGTITGTWKPSTTAAPGLKGTGRFSLRVQGVQTSLIVTKAFVVKYDAALGWKSAHRSGSKVVLTVVAKHDTAGRSVVWKHVDVLFQKRVGSKWKTVAVDETNAKGVAARTVKAGKATWRAVVAASSTIEGATSKSVTR